MHTRPPLRSPALAPPLATILAILGAACANPAGPRAGADAGSVRAVAAGDGVVAVTNGTTRPVFSFAVGRETAALINWAACVDAARCAPLAPDSTRREAFSPTAPSGGREREALSAAIAAARADDAAPAEVRQDPAVIAAYLGEGDEDEETATAEAAA